MDTRPQRMIEGWAMGSKPRAFAYLIGLGLVISIALVGSVAAVSRIGIPQVMASDH